MTTADLTHFLDSTKHNQSVFRMKLNSIKTIMGLHLLAVMKRETSPPFCFMVLNTPSLSCLYLHNTVLSTWLFLALCCTRYLSLYLFIVQTFQHLYSYDSQCSLSAKSFRLTLSNTHCLKSYIMCVVLVL